MTRSMTSAVAGQSVVVGLFVLALAGSGFSADEKSSARPVYRSPADLAFSPDGATIAVSDPTAGCVVLLDAAAGKAVREVGLKGKPSGVAWDSAGRNVYVAECEAGTIAEVSAADGKVNRRIPVGPWPSGLAVARNSGLLLCTDFATHSLRVVDLASAKERANVPVRCMPMSVAVTPDEKTAVVGNSQPAGPASDPATSAEISLVDLATMKKVADLRLPPNGVNIRGVAVSPDGRHAYVVHTLGHSTLPTTQLERGWISVNPLTIVDLEKKECLATLLMDTLSRGAADPWGATVSPDGSTLWVALSGAHQLAKIRVRELHALLDGNLPQGVDDQQLAARGYARVWMEIRQDRAKRELLSYDLSAMYGAGLCKRMGLPCNGPRGIAMSPDGSKVAAAAYFSGTVLICETNNASVLAAIPVGPQPEENAARKGERHFHDASLCFQHWLSCVTCHPGGRTDGLNWDLLNDGIGNPKNSRSMVLAHKTPPMMSLGVREDMEHAVRAGFRFILFREPEPGEPEAVEEYLRSLEPAKSPHLVNGELSAKAKKGRELFLSEKTGCANCHREPLYTDLQIHNVGTRGELDREQEKFDNPTLRELWRTPPYLHDGSATTLRDVLVDRNKGDLHGATSKLTPEEIDALVEFMLSL